VEEEGRRENGREKGKGKGVAKYVPRVERGRFLEQIMANG
jgi:hypothetical protein